MPCVKLTTTAPLASGSASVNIQGALSSHGGQGGDIWSYGLGGRATSVTAEPGGEV